jgi:ribosomal protein L37AE/L43A
MNPADSSPPFRRPRNLLRKLFLLVLLTAAYALSLVLLFLKATWFPLQLFSFFAGATLAVVAGIATRLLLAQRHWLIRFITATVLSVGGLAMLGYFSEWKIGLDLIPLSRGYVSYEDLIHLVIGITVSWAALWAWYRPASRELEIAEAIEPDSYAVMVQPRSLNQPRSWLPQPRMRLGSRVDGHSGNGHGPSVRGRLKLMTRQPTRPKRIRNPRARRPHVQLALVEEHRCPYCLEPVVRTDSRGVKECEVCHSLHHADCWAITGVCQVPHLNT